MRYLSIFLLSFTIALSGALAPGPLLTAVIAETGRSGAKTGPLVCLGHALAELAMVACIVLGLSRVFNQPAFIKVVALAGAAILVFLGLQLLLSLKGLGVKPLTGAARTRNLAWIGMTLSVSNPYWVIWWLSIGAGLVLGAQQNGLVAVGIFFLGHILADLAWYSFVSLLLCKSKRFLSPVIYRRIAGSCALLLVLFGMGFAWYALRA